MLTLLCCNRIASIDVGNTASDDQFLRVSQQEAAEAKRLITQSLRVPQRSVTEFIGTLCQLDQLRWRQRIGKPKHSFLTEIHGFPPRKNHVDRRSAALLAVDSGRAVATSISQKDFIVTLMVLQRSHVSARQAHRVLSRDSLLRNG